MKALLHQKGSVAIEMAYVLPLMILTILMVLETVNYAGDSLVWNENMNSLYHKVMTDAGQGTQNVFKSTTGMLACTNGLVSPTAGAATIMQQQLYTWLKAKSDLVGATLKIGQGDIVVTNQQVTNPTGEAFYVVQASYPVQTLVLPELQAIFKNLSVSGTSIFEINFSCRAS